MNIEPPTANRELVLSVRGISKSFPGVRALHDVDFDAYAGQVHALVGENGAGKSTLIKILAGAQAPDRGEIFVRGQPTTLETPHRALDLGLSFIHQQLNLVPTFSAVENMTLGLPRRHRLGVLIDWRDVRRSARRVAKRLDFDFDIDTAVAGLSAPQQQLVAFGRALLSGASIITMDEPTASLSEEEVKKLYAVVRDLRNAGVAIVYVSHRLDEIFDLADTVTVFKDGEKVVTMPIGEVRDKAHLVTLIVGRAVSEFYPAAQDHPGEVVLRVRDLTWGTRVKNVSFDLRKGEILGLTGLVGAGRSELAHVLFGAHRADSGTVSFGESALRFSSPRAAIDRGIALVPEDRRHQGAIVSMNLRENITLPALKRFRSRPVLPLIDRSAERRATRRTLEDMDVRATGSEQTLATLSGGNQQKVILGKWLLTGAQVLILDEPTQGIDVGAKSEIYNLVERLAATGVSILFISSDLEEIVSICKRVLVMREGRIVANLHNPDDHQILAHCYGSAADRL